MSDTESRVGSEFGPYRLRRLIGKGGMGEVYEAEDTRRDRTVALKLLPAGVSHDSVFRKRLLREAHSAGRLQEPHVVPIHDYGEIDGVLFVDMRLIDGTDLRKILSRYGPMTPARSVAIIKQIASALDAAHESGLVHRDVKPENVLITRDDFAYLVDFGIANAATDERLTELGTAVGTYAYMAPERFSNAEVTYRADIYALAAVLHECLTGSQPFKGDSVSVVISAHLMQPIPRPSAVRPGIPVVFDDVIARGLAKRPEDRYASAGDLAAAAHDALTSSDRDKAATILARGEAATRAFTGVPPPPSYPPSQPTRPPQFTAPPSGPPSGSVPPYQAMPPPSVPPTPPPYAATTQYQPPTPPPFGVSHPPSEPPPSGPPTWQGGSGPMPPAVGPPKRNLTPIIAAIVALVVVVAVVVAVIVLLPSGDNGSSASSTETTTVGPSEKTTTTRPSTTRPTTTTATSGGSGSANAQLMAMLPKGYDSGACKATAPISDAVATVDCKQNSLAGGPDAARYVLYKDATTLAEKFASSIKQDESLFACPGGSDMSPTKWYQDNPNSPLGQIACGTYKNKPDLVWTYDSKLFYADVQGSDMNALFEWWKTNA